MREEGENIKLATTLSAYLGVWIENQLHVRNCSVVATISQKLLLLATTFFL